MASEDPVRRRLAEAYDRLAAERDVWEVERWKLELATEFLDLLPPHPDVLDVGAGTGAFSTYFADRGATVTAIDLAPRHVELAIQRGIDARVVDIVEDDLGGPVHDGVWAMNCLLHVPRARLLDVLERLGRTLVEGGRLVVCQWGGEDHEGPFETDRYDPPRFYSLLPDEAWEGLRVPGLEMDEFRVVPGVHTGRGHHPQVAFFTRVA